MTSNDDTDSTRLTARLLASRAWLAHSEALRKATTLPDALETVLHSVIDITDADFGNIQLVAPGNSLELVKAHGFEDPFINRFRVISFDAHSVTCGKAAYTRTRVIVPDTEADATAYPEIAREAGYRAVQSTPLISMQGELVGVFSTHFATPRLPDEDALRLLDLYACQAADVIGRMG